MSAQGQERRFAVQHLVSGPHLEADVERAQLQWPCIRTDLSSARFHAEVVYGFFKIEGFACEAGCPVG
jgi:hypothetical protein